MDSQEEVGILLVGILYALDDIQEIYYVWLLVDIFETYFTYQTVLRGLCALHDHNRVQSGLVLLVELYPIGICDQIFPNQELCYTVVDNLLFLGDADFHVIQIINGYTDVLRIGERLAHIARTGIGCGD